MNLKTKKYVLTFTEYHDEIEASDKRITVEYQVCRDMGCPLSFVDEDAEIKRHLIDELKEKLNINCSFLWQYRFFGNK